MAESQLLKEVTSVKMDTTRLMSDLASVVQTLIEMGKTEASEKKDKLAKELDAKVLQLRLGVKQAREKGTEAKKKVEEEVALHPWVSVLSALGVGLILGRLLLPKKT